MRRYNKDKNKVKVIGYPFELINSNYKISNAVLYLGNNYQKGDHKENIEYIKMVKMVLEICVELNIPFYYRPHPGEVINSEYGDISKHININNTLLEDIGLAEIVIGDISSAMIEAGLCGRSVIQIIWNELSKNGSLDPMYGFTEKYKRIRKK